MPAKSPQNPNLKALKESWDSPYVAREQVSKFSGGVLHPRTLANHDSLNTGPEGRVRIGRKIAYPVDSLVDWMEHPFATENKILSFYHFPITLLVLSLCSSFPTFLGKNTKFADSLSTR